MSLGAVLDDTRVDEFVATGFVHLPAAFSQETAAQCRDILLRDIIGRDGPAIGLGDYADPPFVAAADTPALHAAFDRLVGPGRWERRKSLGGFVIRTPGDRPARADGWHVDVSFPGEPSTETDYMTWRANSVSRGRALLMLFLFTDVGPDDAPTRLRIGSHGAVARLLAAEGPAGLDAGELARRADAATTDCAVAYATGAAGDVYLCHPFLVHAGQPNRGHGPRVLGQPNLAPAVPLDPHRPPPDRSPVERAIREALWQ
ncbi:phytanoyl-CoA dioxygenase family protein [Nocardia neocaledoniensis]|uniref:phytanoyl-CoA dioxygenase family protein n=1 Tax=Nocardia neocaledoniensis TaxID=236511 RepID=UPI002454BBB8|nr:phytanoyl-CoA dioxygenase family protein [Nocardia neocaledoniensis]